MRPRVKTQEQTAVISELDIKTLQNRLQNLIPALTRNILHARNSNDEVTEVVDSIYYDVRLAVIDAWAETIFPDKFKGMTTSEAGRFDWTSFRYFRENEAVDDIFHQDQIDRYVASRDKKRYEATAFAALHEGMPAFWAVRNPVTTLLQFRLGRYLTEADADEWFRNLNDDRIKAYGAFVDMMGGGCGKNEPVRFVPLGDKDPSEEGLVFLGWVFVRSEAKPKMEWGEFGSQYGAIFGFENATFNEHQLNQSSFEHSVKHKWSASAG